MSAKRIRLALDLLEQLLLLSFKFLDCLLIHVLLTD